MQDLGANSIRVYHVEPQLDHDACMTAFSDAGVSLAQPWWKAITNMNL